MADALTPQNLLAAPGAAAGGQALELDEIQGDVLIGLQKNVERFLFFEIKDVKKFKGLLRHRIAHHITTTHTVQLREFQLRDQKSHGHKTPLPNVGVNVAFSNDGIGKLVPGADLKDPSFATGAKKQAKNLNDPVDAQGNPTTWLAKFLNATIDGVFLITGGTNVAVDDAAALLLSLLGASVTVSWRNIVDFQGLPLYPRMHVAPDGRVFMSGPLQTTQYLDTSGGGQWTVVGDRINKLREYGPSVMFDQGKILFAGGGDPPTNAAEIIDLNEPAPAWKATGAMSFPRRQHNATLLPDGTVLVTGGTSGGGFNDLTKPVKKAELWDPATGLWTELAAEDTPRMYHSIAVLLPDARVLSAGGGEYRPDNVHENDPKDSHRDGQIFSPPYLFRGARPDITAAPDEVTYGQNFDVTSSHPDQIAQVNWIRLSSVTHSFNQNQRINFLKFTALAAKLTVTAPANANLCPPGHYMLFVLNKAKVPSVAKIVRIH